MNQRDIHFLVIDLFCGAGGTSTGVKKSGVGKVIAAINHNPIAISSHAANHENVLHITEDILIADLQQLIKIVAYWKRIYPHARLILWGSLECTNFSDAKGGLPRDADSRALAEGMFRYLDALHPDYFLIENVEEFMAWGPLKPKEVKCASGDYCPLHYGKTGHPGPHLIPESRRAGKDYVRWVKQVQSYGYRHDWRLLCAADFGGVTIRERYFGAFYKPGLPFAWPQRTHAKRPAKGTMFTDDLKPWRAVAEVLDFSDLGKSIFDRKKPLVDKSLRRVLKGLRKFHAIPQIVTYNSPGYCLPADRPIGALTTNCSKAIMVPFLQSYYSGSDGVSSTLQPAPTVPNKDRFGLITPWIDRNFKSGRYQSVNEPAGTLLTVPKINLCTAFLLGSGYCGNPRRLTLPAPTVVASRRHINITSAFIVNPQYRSAGSAITAPAPTVIRSQKSFPLSIATTTHDGVPRWTISETDTEVMIELKTYMKENGIADIFMRMLFVLELKRIQGFPDDYILHGNQTQQKEFIGNSVETGVVSSWLQSMAIEIGIYNTTKTAAVAA